MRLMFLMLPLYACTAEGVLLPEPVDTGTELVGTDTTPPQSACGQVSTWDVTLVGVATRPDGGPAGSATIRLEDRGWAPGTIVGEALTNHNGEFQLELAGLTSVEDCWGTILNYVLTGHTISAYGERPLNPPLLNAIEDGSLHADVSGLPLVLEQPAR